MGSSNTDKFRAENLLSNGELLSHFMPIGQRFALKDLIHGEEGDHFVSLVIDLAKRIRDMPHTYQTEDVEGGDKVAHLHYFRGGVDAWIVEKGMGDGSGDLSQIQAYGKCTLFGGGIDEAEWGYISITELIENDVELDLYWTPKPIKECSTSQEADLDVEDEFPSAPRRTNSLR